MAIYEPKASEIKLAHGVMRASRHFQDQYGRQPDSVEINSLYAPAGLTHIYGIPVKLVEYTPPGHVVVTDGKRIVMLAVD